MNKHSDARPTAVAATPASVIRRFFNAWRRWEEDMDSSPTDYALHRIGQLEYRVRELERARNGDVASKAQ